ncbi:hypothetical protein E4T42_02026 [Aureobasidium subglaciale]|nr:hypothetical protein E4T42_02026 [Aureobasidium subglaciale]
MEYSFRIDMKDTPTDSSSELHRKVLDGIEDLLLVLAEDGRVLYASPQSFKLIQVKPEALVGSYVSTHMNVDDIPVFLLDFKENMATGNAWRSHHRLRRKDDTYLPFESTFKPYTDTTMDKELGTKQDTKLCLMISRPYQMSSTSLMDSILEHHTTHIRLTKQLARLHGEIEECRDSTTPTTSHNQNSSTTKHATISIETMSPNEPAGRPNSPTGLSTFGSAFSRKRSLSVSSTSTKPQVDSVLGDVGIEIATSRLRDAHETGAWRTKPRTKKPKIETLTEYLCTDCGIANSPEWRRGPCGPKTLCNACGLRWSKAHKEPNSKIKETGSSIQ